MACKCFDYAYKNSTNLALVALVVLILGFVLFQMDLNLGSGISPQYFAIALPLIFIALMILPSLDKKLINFRTLCVPAILGFVLLFIIDIYRNSTGWIPIPAGLAAPGYEGTYYYAYNPMLDFLLTGIAALVTGALAAMLIKSKKGLALIDSMRINFVIYAKILFIYLIVTIFSAVWMESISHHGGPDIILYSHLSMAWLLTSPLYHMAVFMLGSTAGVLLMQKLRKK